MGGKLALILMAAGAGRRFNGDKLAAPFRGRPLWQQALETARLAAEGKNALLIPVTRIPGLFNSPGVIPVENLSPALGVSHTVRLGLKKAAELGADGAVFLVCDQPLLRPATLARLMESHRPGMISCVRSGGVPGNPVLFDRAYFPELLALSGDRGGKAVMGRHPDRVLWVEAEAAEELWDIDRAEDMRKLEAFEKEKAPGENG